MRWTKKFIDIGYGVYFYLGRFEVEVALTYCDSEGAEGLKGELIWLQSARSWWRALPTRWSWRAPRWSSNAAWAASRSPTCCGAAGVAPICPWGASRSSTTAPWGSRRRSVMTRASTYARPTTPSGPSQPRPHSQSTVSCSTLNPFGLFAPY